MMLVCQLAVGFFNFIFSGVPGHAQYFVVIVHMFFAKSRKCLFRNHFPLPYFFSSKSASLVLPSPPSFLGCSVWPLGFPPWADLRIASPIDCKDLESSSVVFLMISVSLSSFTFFNSSILSCTGFFTSAETLSPASDNDFSAV